MEKTFLNRYTSNHIAWLGNLIELCNNKGDSKLIPFIKENFLEIKQRIPKEVQERSGLAKYNTLQEMQDMDNWNFGELCLYFANASIYDTFVLWDKEKNRYIYVANVDNTNFFYPLLLADFLVNTKVFKEANDTSFVIYIKGIATKEHDPFVNLMQNVFPLYFKDVSVVFD